MVQSVDGKSRRPCSTWNAASDQMEYVDRNQSWRSVDEPLADGWSVSRFLVVSGVTLEMAESE